MSLNLNSPQTVVRTDTIASANVCVKCDPANQIVSLRFKMLDGYGHHVEIQDSKVPQITQAQAITFINTVALPGETLGQLMQRASEPRLLQLGVSSAVSVVAATGSGQDAFNAAKATSMTVRKP